MGGAAGAAGVETLENHLVHAYKASITAQLSSEAAREKPFEAPPQIMYLWPLSTFTGAPCGANSGFKLND